MRTKWLAILALSCAWPAVAQERAEAPDFAAMTEAELRELADASLTTGFSEACGNDVPLLAELARRNPHLAGFQALHLTAQAICADGEQRYEEGLSLLKQAERVFPQPIFPGLGLYFADRLNDGAEALSRLRGLAEDGQLTTIPVDMVFAGIRTVRRDGHEEAFDAFSYEITASRRFAELDPDLQGAFATGAIRHAVRIAQLSRVEGILEHQSNPSSYLDMLSDRDYEAAWPLIEDRAGDNLGNVADAFVKSTAERLAADPEDRDRLSRYAHALLFAGRFLEAVEVARNWRPERADLTGLAEGDAWSLNIEAYALDALGRRQEADAVFDQLATLPADEYPWVVNFVINRASRLVGQERWQEGLAATELARSVADKHGSTYAKLIIARDRACALQRLGRDGEIAREVEFLVEEFNVNAPIATTGLLCVGEQSEAERLLAQALSEEVPRGGVLDEIQDSRFELFYTPTALPQARDLILANETLRSEVLKYARLLPERFVPISYVRRRQIADRAE